MAENGILTTSTFARTPSQLGLHVTDLYQVPRDQTPADVDLEHFKKLGVIQVVVCRCSKNPRDPQTKSKTYTDITNSTRSRAEDPPSRQPGPLEASQFPNLHSPIDNPPFNLSNPSNAKQAARSGPSKSAQERVAGKDQAVKHKKTESAGQSLMEDTGPGSILGGGLFGLDGAMSDDTYPGFGLDGGPSDYPGRPVTGTAYHPEGFNQAYPGRNGDFHARPSFGPPWPYDETSHYGSLAYERPRYGPPKHGENGGGYHTDPRARRHRGISPDDIYHHGRPPSAYYPEEDRFVRQAMERGHGPAHPDFSVQPPPVPRRPQPLPQQESQWPYGGPLTGQVFPQPVDNNGSVRIFLS